MHFCVAVERDWQITSVSGLDAAILVVLCVAGLAVVAWTWRSLDPSYPKRIRTAITLLRGVAVVASFALLMQPTLHIRRIKSKPSKLAVLVDTSGSMMLGEQENRLKRAKASIRQARSQLKALEKSTRIVWYTFDRDVVRIDDPSQIDHEGAAGTGTDIHRAVQKVLRQSREDEIDGVVVISDGADTETHLGEDGKWRTAAFKTLGVPVNTVFVGDNRPRSDLAISQVEVAPFAFTRSVTPVAVHLRSTGLDDQEVEAFLKQDGTVLQRRTTRLVGGKGRLEFNLLPTDLGQQVYEIALPVQKGDAVPENNRRHFVVDVIRDKIRILHLAGRPSWDQRFLRETLKSWPNIDLVSFYVLRTAYQSATEGSAGMALIPFPTDELFKDHLGEFDILIFHEFEPSSVGVESYAEKIAAFVRQGGALVVVAGEQGLKGGIMGGKVLEELLPVRLLPAGTPASRLSDSTPFRPRLTEAGGSHPVTQLLDEPEQNRQLWRSLLRLDGVGRVAGLMPGAHSLVEHPILPADDGPASLLSVREVEKGRTMAITTDTLWTWRFTGPMGGHSADAYTKLWKKAVAWLTDAPELKRLRLSVTPSPVTIGQAAQIQVELLDASYRPIQTAPISYTISWIDPEGVRREESFNAKVDANGKYHAVWRPKTEGAHMVTATSQDGLKNVESFLVITDNRERYHMDPEPSLLRAIAEATGGHYSDNTIEPGRVATVPGGGREVMSQLALTLWDHPLAILLILGVIVAEWMFRRRLGLR